MSQVITCKFLGQTNTQPDRYVFSYQVQGCKPCKKLVVCAHGDRFNAAYEKGGDTLTALTLLAQDYMAEYTQIQASRGQCKLVAGMLEAGKYVFIPVSRK